MNIFWHLTKGSLCSGGSNVRVFLRRPNNGPYIVESREAGNIYLTDDNDNMLKSIPKQESTGKNRKIIDEFIINELNKLNFERPSVHTSCIGNKKKQSYRMMEGEEYEDRKVKKSTKPKRKCKCKK
jgi:hypothetical protein